MAIEYSYAPEVADVAAEVIREHHPHLEDKTIVYVFRSPAATKGKKVVLGKARKITGLSAFLSEYTELGGSFFVMEVSAENWKSMAAPQRRALVDHELLHMDVDEDGRPIIVGHDVEEFTAVVERHGLWKSDVEAFALAVQLQLPNA